MTLTQRILSYVGEHPGCLRRDIAQALGLVDTPLIITDTLTRLRREGKVVREIPNGVTAKTRWYLSQSSLFPNEEGYS